MSSSLKSTLAVALSLLQAVPALAADANGKVPYFRFNSCPEGTVCAPPPGSGKTGQEGAVQAGSEVKDTPASQVATALSFDTGTYLQDGVVGTPVSGRYVAKGGKSPYAMTLSGAPPGFALAPLNATSWALTGVMDLPAAYALASVVLTDGAGQSVSFPIPLTVTRPAPEPEVAAFAFDRTTPLADGQQSVPQYPYFSFDGGTAPYTWSLSGSPLPPSLTVRRSDMGSTYGDIYAVIDQVGTYDNLKLTVTDGANRQISYAFPKFTISRNSLGDTAMEVTYIGAFPPSLAIGETWESQVFTVSGFKEDKGYNVNMVGGPYGFEIRSVGPQEANQFQIFYTATKDGVGSFSAVGIDVTSRFESEIHKVVTIGDLKVIGAPLQIASQFPPSTRVSTQTDFSVVAKVSGGSSLPPTVTLSGTPADANLSLYTEARDDGLEIALKGSLPRDGTYAGITVNYVDTMTGERVAFTPFAVTAIGTPLSDCTGMPTGADALTARMGDYAEIPYAVTFRGGVGPFTVTPDAVASVPEGLGFKLDPDYAGTGDVRMIPASIEPTEVVAMSSVAATLRDAKGSSCPVTLSATTTVPPDPNLGPKATAEAYNLSDGYRNGEGTRYWDLAVSNGQYFRPALSVEGLKGLVNGDFCIGCMRILIKAPPGKQVAFDGPPFDPEFQTPRIRLHSYSSGSVDRKLMLTPQVTRLDAGPDEGTYVPGLVLDWTRDTPVVGRWVYVFSVEYADGTAGLTLPLTVEFFGDGAPMAAN